MRKIEFEIDKCLACRSCEIACAIEHSKSKDIYKAHLEDDKPVQRRNLKKIGSKCFTISCYHCEDALCIEACITSAIRKNENGEVICDSQKCIGCGMCIMVCPFGAIKLKETYIVKCDMCPDRKDSYACIEACPTKALKEEK